MALLGMDALEVAKHAAIKRESSRLIKKKALEHLYKDMTKTIQDEIYKIKDRIAQQMVINKNNNHKNHRYNKVAFFVGRTYEIDDYIQVFEHCYNDVLDDPLIEQLQRKFPDYKVYRKVKTEYDRYENETDVYIIYVKWKKNHAL